MPEAQDLPSLLETFHTRYGPAAGEEGPYRFVTEVLGATPDDWQEAVLRAIGRGERRISIVSCHGPGKTATAAWVITWQNVCTYPQVTACTAPTGGQLHDVLGAEVKRWFEKLPGAIQAAFNVTSTHIKFIPREHNSFTTFKTAKAETPEALQGVHCEGGKVLLVVDEASGVPESIFEAAAGSMSGENATTLLLSNGTRSSGFFFETHHKLAHMWFTKQISYVDSPRVSMDFVEDIIARYGRDSNAFRIRCLGEFPLADADTIIPYPLVIAATTRDVKSPHDAPIVWGLDVAREGNDRTVLCKRRANELIEPPKRWSINDTMLIVGRIKHEWDSTRDSERPESINIDLINMGYGVTDRLKELGLPARGINVSETPAVFKDRYKNVRTELWFRAKEWFEGRDCKIPPMENEPGQDKPIDCLVAELTMLRYDPHGSSGQVIAEPKKSVKDRGYASPDHADAFVLTFAGDFTLAMGRTRKRWKEPLKRGSKWVV